MHDLTTLKRLNRYAVDGWPPQCLLRHHPRIQALREQISRLPVVSHYKAALHRSLGLYADQLVSRPDCHPEDVWGDLEALQQVTLGDWMEETAKSLA